jgi:hypothetical protein
VQLVREKKQRQEAEDAKPVAEDKTVAEPPSNLDTSKQESTEETSLTQGSNSNNEEVPYLIIGLPTVSRKNGGLFVLFAGFRRLPDCFFSTLNLCVSLPVSS